MAFWAVLAAWLPIWCQRVLSLGYSFIPIPSYPVKYPWAGHCHSRKMLCHHPDQQDHGLFQTLIFFISSLSFYWLGLGRCIEESPDSENHPAPLSHSTYQPTQVRGCGAIILKGPWGFMGDFSWSSVDVQEALWHAMKIILRTDIPQWHHWQQVEILAFNKTIPQQDTISMEIPNRVFK